MTTERRLRLECIRYLIAHHMWWRAHLRLAARDIADLPLPQLIVRR
jgi:hypothetical protein